MGPFFFSHCALGKFSAACGGKARCRSTQMYPKNRGVRKAVAKLVAEVHKRCPKIALYGRQWPNSLQKYTKDIQKSRCTEGVAKLVTEAFLKKIHTGLANHWHPRFLSVSVAAGTSILAASRFPFLLLLPLASAGLRPAPFPLPTAGHPLRLRRASPPPASRAPSPPPTPTP